MSPILTAASDKLDNKTRTFGTIGSCIRQW